MDDEGRSSAASCKIISMDPVLWRTLPKELLRLVFARLPVPDIIRLRSLSKEWNKDTTTANSKFNQAYDGNSTVIVAGLSQREKWDDSGMPTPEFLVTICAQSYQNSYRLPDLGDPIRSKNRWGDMGALHSGLACFVSTWSPSKSNPLCIVVVNLLTGVKHKLPSLKVAYYTLPHMMHIEVDYETKCYRVVVIWRNKKGGSRVEIYDSGARQWTQATPSHGCIFGVVHSWNYDMRSSAYKSRRTTPSMYDFAGGQLKPIRVSLGSLNVNVMTNMVHQDLMFVVHKFSVEFPWGCYGINKYRMQNDAKEWVGERAYYGTPFEELFVKNVCRLTLKVIEGYLLVFEPVDGDYRYEYFWLLDLSTQDMWSTELWSRLPNCFDDEDLECGISMTRASWKVVP